MRRLIVFIVALALLLPIAAYAGDDGGTESVFSIGAGARAMGMGNGFVGLADDASAIYYNPSGLPFLASQQISFLHTVLFEETSYDFISYVYPYQNSAFGFAVMRLGTDDIGRRDADYYDLGRFSASQMQFMVSYGRRLTNRFSSGVSFKMANNSIDNYSAYGFGLDVAGLYKVNDHLRAGVLLQDIVGAKMQLIDAKESTPFTLKTGVVYTVGSDIDPIKANFTLDVDKPENRSLKLRTGVEAIHSSGLILRSGYDRDNLALGMGIRYQDLTFDYAYKIIENLPNSHRFSFTFNFGMSTEEKQEVSDETTRQRNEKLLAEARKQSLLAELKKADNFYDKGMYDSALVAFYRADAFADEKGYINSRIGNIQSILGTSRTTPPAIVIDSSASGPGVDFLSQAQRLYAQGALVNARDMVEMARKFGSGTPELDSIDLAISVAIDERVNDNITKARQAFDNGDYISAYDFYNTVLVYNTSNSLARKGSKMAEKRLNLAQHLNLGLEYYNQGKYISSQKSFKRALDVDKNNATALEYLALINVKIKESTSLEDLQKDERVWQMYLDGLEAFRRADYEKAIELWDDVLEVYPNNKNTRENIEQARLRLKK